MNQPKNALPEVDAPLLHRCDARGVHVLTLNTPARFNVLGESMLGALESAFEQVRADSAAGSWCWAPQAKRFAPAMTSRR
jgi:hypothetical protein